jgi:hypothetical protein
MSCSLTSSSGSSYRRRTSRRIGVAGDDHRRALGVEARHPAALVEGKCGETGKLVVDRGRPEPVPVDPLRVVFLESEVEGGKRRDRAGDADRALSVQRGEEGSHIRTGGVRVVAEALGQAHGADVEARAPGRGDQLGRAAADVDDDRVWVEAAAAGDAAQRQLGLFVPGEEPGLEPVAPLDLSEEGLAVLGVADGARRDGEGALGAEPLDGAAVVREDVSGPRDRHRQQASALVDALAQACDHQRPRNLR